MALRASAVVGARRGDAVVVDLRLGRLIGFDLLALGFQLRIDAARRERARCRDGHGRSGTGGGCRAGGDGAPLDARLAEDVGFGRARRRRQVAVLDAAGPVLPLPLRIGRQGQQRSGQRSEENDGKTDHGSAGVVTTARQCTSAAAVRPHRLAQTGTCARIRIIPFCVWSFLCAFWARP
jgi:hypothetical protein